MALSAQATDGVDAGLKAKVKVVLVRKAAAAVKGSLIATSTRQGTVVDLDSLVSMHGTRVLDEFEILARHEQYVDKDHVLLFVPVEHEQYTEKLGYTVCGGVEIHHLGCCPGDGGVGNRLDAVVFLEHVHLGPRESSPVQFPPAESQVRNGR